MLKRFQIRTDGLVVRKSIYPIYTIPLNGKMYQWWKDGESTELSEAFQVTKIKDQYLLMPKSILDSWTEDRNEMQVL